MIDEETMTVVDAEQEKILKQREFNQALTKFRGINKVKKNLPLKQSKNVDDILLKGTPPLENIYLPITDIMQRVKRGGSKYLEDKEIKSIKNVLKMIAGLYTGKLTIMEKSANDTMALMNIDGFFYHHV